MRADHDTRQNSLRQGVPMRVAFFAAAYSEWKAHPFLTSVGKQKMVKEKHTL